MTHKPVPLLLKSLAVSLFTGLTVQPATLAEQKPQWVPISPKSDLPNPTISKPNSWLPVPEAELLPTEKTELADINLFPVTLRKPQWIPITSSNPPGSKAVTWQNAPDKEFLATQKNDVAGINSSTSTLSAGQSRLIESRPQLYSLNRSIAFSNQKVGPDIAWRAPTGFQWTPHRWLDLTVDGFSRRADGESFSAWNGGDAVGKLFINVANTQSLSFTLIQSFRSVSLFDDGSTAGASTPFGEGLSTGFRFGFPLGKNAGLAIGGEQIIQWDDFTDTGRTFYIAASKGWWLGSGLDAYPLAVANVALGSGRLASDPNTRFACADTGEKRTGTFSIDNKLCWAPVGSLALVMNPNFSIFTEYNSVRWLLGASLAPIPEFPLRFTGAVNLANQIPKNGFEINDDTMTWSFRLSVGL